MSIRQVNNTNPTRKLSPALVFTPPKMRTFRLWAGLYGGHTDHIVFFRKKPTHYEDRNAMRFNPEKDMRVDLLAEHDARNIFADLGTGDFEQWFPGWIDACLPYLQSREYPRPKETDISLANLFQINLTVPVDPENPNDICTLNVHCDW